ncbi:thioredoxin domain-containing protein [Exiguobacterium sp. KRL4]|uniref:thioredoxin domain-containing protein n=1 Tax=Exiguobacterium sp. KRL4 TaxID=1914536 RepID=UPI0008F83524|nr:thioredoxin domain-containing protein [Exiguobacterium sp. KRL4]OIN65839.1 thioredoxin domain-containing protein [Exiguobacterium sp. KRL4]
MMTNRLIHEKSPYLLQHATNPVDWYPWGEEAFSIARATNKPIFLSIGYSTCHWCHVLAHESFEDEETARMLNERFVSIKVDREERPDIDQIYMTAAQLMNGQGGWPLSVFLSPDQTPFYIGTYFPKTPQFNRPSFRQVILQLSEHYRTDPEKIKRVGNEIIQALTDVTSANTTGQLNETLIHDTFDQAMRQFDVQNGGFGEAPKFPSPSLLTFLLDYYRFAEDETALQMVIRTLTAMRDGGITDQIGFGLCRYTVDERWDIPHFEKMLYDNALFATLCIETYQVSGRERFKQYAEEVFTYIERDLLSPDGAFYSAEDADSEGREGTFYTFTYDELLDVLGEDALFPRFYQATPQGNFDGRNVFRRTDQSVQQFADDNGRTVQKTLFQLEQERQTLLHVRSQRVRPFRDDKILTAWNALMISAYAKAGRVFDDHHYTDVALRALTFLETHLMDDDRLRVRYREGHIQGNGFLDDYSFLTEAYLELHQTTQQTVYIQQALRLTDRMIQDFGDEQGSFFFTSVENETLLVRPKDIYDGVKPAGNSTAVLNLIRLSQLTGRTDYRERAQHVFSALALEVESQPTGFASLLSAYVRTWLEPKELIVLTDSLETIEPFLADLHKRRLPELSLLVGKKETLLKVAPFIADYRLIDSQPTAYLCQDFQCERPTTNLSELLHQIIE